MERSLIILKDVGIIILGEKTEKFYTVLDIKDNPKNIKIIETEISTTARSINDVDAIICPAQRVKVADIDPNSFLYEDPLSKNHPQSLVVNSKDVDANWVKETLKLFETEDFKKKFNEYHNGTYVLYNN